MFATFAVSTLSCCIRSCSIRKMRIKFEDKISTSSLKCNGYIYSVILLDLNHELMLFHGVFLFEKKKAICVDKNCYASSCVSRQFLANGVQSAMEQAPGSEQ